MNYRLGSRKTIEFLLLIECCRWSFTRANGEEIRALARRADWRRFLDLCSRHRVEGLVQRCLRALPLALPSEIARSLSKDAAAIAEHNLRAARESSRLLDAFTAADIPLLFVKGLTLSKLAYGDPFVKMSHDVDVLVPGDSIARAAALLDQLGYRLTLPAATDSAPLERWHRQRKESVWRSPDGLTLELHSRLADSPQLIPGIGVHSPRREIEVSPGIELPTLAADELFAYLCVHGASSAWFRLKWIADLAGLLNDCSAQEIGRLFERSQQLGAGRAAAQALLLAAATFGTAAGSDLQRRLGRRRADRWLARAAWAQMTRVAEPTRVRLGTATIHLTQLLLLPGLGFKLRELSRQLSDMRS
ncbi:nucleotidyltransferase family protein [Sphingomonas sp.]|uniref:nucleotidyltransferase domain-containing protein n=1 Tax=Sphingomonas sp. TaxID=28214 RepID=UPI00182B8827|nr:nucleotidyltransferase family protein [Sphingomonas sp.]MBA3512358.1 nucleotidyltransferase family protein [Sphingomonas sp.]